MANGYYCEDCELAVWPATTRAELKWLRERQNIVREVEKHLSGGVDSWIEAGLAFLDEHHGHSVLLRERD